MISNRGENSRIVSNNSSPTMLRIENLDLSFGGTQCLAGVTFDVKQGELLAIIGPNGAGKTSLINCISGFYRPQQGEIYFDGQKITKMPEHKIAKIGIARTFQNIELFTGLTTLENLMAARHLYLKPGVLSSAIYFGWAQKKEIEHRRRAEEIIDFLKMEAIRNRPTGIIPYGLRKRVELGRALALEPKLLLLDEPLPGMNVDEKEDMARFILDISEELGVTIILVEHDMDVVMDIASRIVVLDFGHKIAEGSPEEIKVNPDVMKAYLGQE